MSCRACEPLPVRAGGARSSHLRSESRHQPSISLDHSRAQPRTEPRPSLPPQRARKLLRAPAFPQICLRHTPQGGPGRRAQVLKREVPGLSPGAPQSAKGATALLGLHQLPRRLPEEAAGPGFSPGTPQSPEGAAALLGFHQLPHRPPEKAAGGRRGLPPGAPQSAQGPTALLGLHQLPRRPPERAARPGLSPGTPQSPEGATALLDFHQLPRRLPEEATGPRLSPGAPPFSCEKTGLPRVSPKGKPQSPPPLPAEQQRAPGLR